MDCQDMKNQMMDWALNELSPENARAMEQHASACPGCGAQMQRLLRVHDVLKRGWRDEEIPASLVFTPVARAGFWQWLLAAPRWANVSMAAVAVMALLFVTLSAARVEFQYDRGHFAVAFGQSAPALVSSPALPSVPVSNAAFTPVEIQKLVAAQYAALSEQDRARYAAQLDQFAQQMQTQRENDLQHIGAAFDQVKTVVWKDMQSNSALVQYAAQRIANEVKN